MTSSSPAVQIIVAWMPARILSASLVQGEP
jgi:hypothetical protein